MKNLNTLRLKSQTIDDLKEILTTAKIKGYDDLEGKSKAQLVTIIEENVESNNRLKSKLSKLKYSFKPSFYLTYIKDKSSFNKNLVTRKKISLKLKQINKEKDSEPNPSIRQYELFEIQKTGQIIELHFLWQTIHWYWSVDYNLKNIYELNYGLALIDLENNKAIISCHTKKERNDLFRVIADAVKIELKPLHLTKPLLNQIGSFDSVKRARYFVDSKELPLPENLTLGDDNLSTKALAREQEENLEITRKESFYRIPIRGIEEQGVGVTSETGKLWIPQQVTVSEIKDFSSKLLSKVAKELDQLSDSGEYTNVIDSLGIKASKELVSISNIKLREEIFRLFVALANMLLNNNPEKAFAASKTIMSDGIPLFFNPFKIVLDGQTGNFFFGELDNLFQLDKSSEETKLLSAITKQEIKEIIDKDSGEIIPVKEALEKTLITPTAKLESILLELLKMLGAQHLELNKLLSLPFKIESGILKLNIKRAYGKENIKFLTEIKPKEIDELKQILNRSYTYDLPKKTFDLMGEKCEHMSDENCFNCLEDKKYACLRTLVAKTLKNPYLLAHKGIELSDLQGDYNYNGDTLKLFVFAKLSKTKTGLTARNQNGTILLGQIINQISLSTFNTVAILTSSTLNEDLLNNIKHLCFTFGKKLLIINTKELDKLFGYWYSEMETDGRDPIKILKNSSKKLRTAINKHKKTKS